MTEKFVFHSEILARKADIKRILITNYWEKKIVDHILQSDGELTNREEECVEGGTLVAHQVSKTLSILKTLKVPRDRY